MNTRRYCADCGRWTMSFVPVNDRHIAKKIVFRPGTTKVRNRGTKEARRHSKNAGYLCDACAHADSGGADQAE